tara:strand:- start:1 stop:291 length:291 start_codon:yes stop_codon:yes gene_type:complete
LFVLQERLRQALEAELGPQGEAKLLQEPEVELEQQVVGGGLQGQGVAKQDPWVQAKPCQGEVGVVNPVQGGLEHSFSCLCADPCGSPLNRWMRVES